MDGMKKLLIVLAMVLVVAGSGFGKLIKRFWPGDIQKVETSTQKIVTEENMVIEVAEKVSPSVVTVGISKTQTIRQIDPFNFFRQQFGNPDESIQEQKIEQDIGSGFVISKDGLIATNKHVVADTTAKYRVITKNDKEYQVEKIYRDPANDLAILKISPNGENLVPVTLGDSAKLKVGQFVVAIGTALGEFRHTVTTGVVSGLGRGIQAGSPYENSVERLDDVIQTDAAINPGNSGGPLLNSAGEVIGINTAVSAQGQNIGFAIPINVIKTAIDNFNSTGQFSRPYIGIRYRMLDLQTAMRYDVPVGALIQEVLPESPAEKAGLEAQDIITKIDDKKMAGEDTVLSTLISGKKIGDKIQVEYWRDGDTKTKTVILEEAK